MKKKTVLVFCIFISILADAYAAQPANLAFEFTLGNVIDFVPGVGTSLPTYGVGFSYSFTPKVNAGVSFLPALQYNFINVGINVVGDLDFRLYYGLSGVETIAGLGLSYDVLKGGTDYFGALGIFIDWLAGVNNAGDYPLNQGGAVVIGLRTKFGF
jgi:hypothetical protein